MASTSLAKLILIAIPALTAVTVRGYSYVEDFSVGDGNGFARGIDRQVNSTYSHGHAAFEPGKYTILLSGNRHYFTTPRLRDFQLTAIWGVDCEIRDAHDIGLSLSFRDDRAAHPGHELQVHGTPSGGLRIALDGKDLLVRKTGCPDFSSQHLTLEVEGVRGRLEVAGAKVDFALPAEDVAGFISIDSLYAPGTSFVLTDVRIDSPESPERKPVGRWRFNLGTEQGFALSPVVDVAIDRFETGEAVLSAKLSGTQLSRTNRIETGGVEWCSPYERLTAPYVRIENAAVGVSRTFFFWNGMKQIYDEVLYRNKVGSTGLLPEVKWPATFQTVIRDLPEMFTVAAGYEKATCDPWRFAENGPYEQILNMAGESIYTGEAVGDGRIAVRVVSPEDKKIVGLIPKDIPGYAAARRHAETQHYFFESEHPVFEVELGFCDADYEAQELSASFSLTDVFGKDVGGTVTFERNREHRTGTVRTIVYSVNIPKLKCGIWHLRTKVEAGGRSVKNVYEVFEVLSDDRNGPCPPLASGLPEFVSMPNEMKYLESDAFDPWSERGGLSHYFTTVDRYPAVAAATEIWRLLPLYRRRWFCQSLIRNTDQIDSRNDFNREMIRRCDYFGGDENRTPVYHRFDFSLLESYTDLQMDILREFIVERKPGLEKLTLSAVDGHIAAGEHITAEELRELVEKAWTEFVPYARAKVDAITSGFEDYVFTLNPRVGRGSYGPMSVYTSCWKSAYHLRVCGRSVNSDPRIRDNGSFFLLEDYHFPCDYPISRASYYTATYGLMYPRGRKIYPEIYYTGWDRCMDGAVFRAHPTPTTSIPAIHQRRIAYQFGYGTPQFKDGKFRYWTDDGFHARNPELESLEEFVYAWGRLRDNRPMVAPKSPFVVTDGDAFFRHGDYFEDEYNHNDPNGEFPQGKTDVCNTAEEDVGYAYEKCCLAGYATPVVTDYGELDRIDAQKAEFVVLPPVDADTPPSIVASIRKLHERGVNLMCFESVCGLEDIFGVRLAPEGERSVGYVPGEEPFHHKKAKARYVASGAEVRLFGARDAESSADIPLVFFKQGKTGRAVFVNVPPTVVRRAPIRYGFNYGQNAVSIRMSEAFRDAYRFLAPEPMVKTKRGSVLTAFTADGDLVVIIADDAPIYHDPTVYPVAIRFKVSLSGVGAAKIESDATYGVVSRTDDKLVLRADMPRSGSLFFKFVTHLSCKGKTP